MPKNPKAKKQKTIKKAASPRRGLRLVAIFVLLIAIFAALGWFFYADRPISKVRGSASLTDRQLQSLSDSQKYQSLDLRVAALAVYKGRPLQVDQELGVFGGVRQRIISFPVYSAGLVEKGLMTLPFGPAPAGGYPVIVLCHGYVDPRRYSTYKAYLSQMQYYSQNGFAVVKPDFRGNGLSQNAGSPEGAYYSMAYNVDLLSLLASIKDTPYLNTNQISAWGHSMGAYIALRAAVLSPDIKNVILLSGPVGDIKDMYTSGIAPSDRSNPVAFLIRSSQLAKHGTPLSNPGFWYNVSPLNFLEKSNTHFQIHVGEQDRVVPPRFSAELDSALTQAHKGHQYYTYFYGDHGLVPEMPTILSRSLALLQNGN